MESTEISEFNDENAYMSDVEEDRGGSRDDEAQEVSGPPSGEVIKAKRIIKNPQPKLDATRLMGPRGIGILPSTFKDVKFKGKGYEKDDLSLMMKKLEHWAHRLFPKLTFDDTLKQLEKLGTKKPVQNLVRRIRLDMFQVDELVGEPASNTHTNIEEEVDVFDELLGTGPFASSTSNSNTSGQNISDFVGAGQFTELPIPTTPFNNPSQDFPKPMSNSLTEEQKERIERNKRLAAERRKAKMMEQQHLVGLPNLVQQEALEESSLGVSQNIFPLVSDASIFSQASPNTMEDNDSLTTSVCVDKFSSIINDNLVQSYKESDSVSISKSSDSSFAITEIPKIIRKPFNLESSLVHKDTDKQDSIADVNGVQDTEFLPPSGTDVFKHATEQNKCTEEDVLALMED